ncbi:MAG: dihydroneopterin aldolase [Rhodobacteraceae bacterium]|nr:dihydroneopterin aldolase [Paracoccaceae bacterium]
MSDAPLTFALSATAAGGDDPTPDRISVRDHVREVEIGAFASERGVTQRLRFNVLLEVVPGGAAETDDVDKVLSYDVILGAIDAGLAGDRLNLLETLAERIAAIILTEPRALRVALRIEKLDRIPGALGVEILRSRAPGQKLRALPVAAQTGPLVLLLPVAVWRGSEALDWARAAGATGPAVLVLAPPSPAMPACGDAGADRHIRHLASEQAAWHLLGRLRAEMSDVVVADSRTELDWALKTGRLALWGPARMLRDSPTSPADETPEAMAAWLAERVGARAARIAGPARGGLAGLAAPADIHRAAT